MLQGNEIFNPKVAYWVVIETAKVLFANQADYILVKVSIKSELLSDEELLERRTSKADSECPLYLQVEVNSR